MDTFIDVHIDFHRIGDPTMNAAGVPEGALAGPDDGAHLAPSAEAPTIAAA